MIGTKKFLTRISHYQFFIILLLFIFSTSCIKIGHVVSKDSQQAAKLHAQIISSLAAGVTEAALWIGVWGGSCFQPRSLKSSPSSTNPNTWDQKVFTFQTNGAIVLRIIKFSDAGCTTPLGVMTVQGTYKVNVNNLDLHFTSVTEKALSDIYLSYLQQKLINQNIPLVKNQNIIVSTSPSYGGHLGDFYTLYQFLNGILYFGTASSTAATRPTTVNLHDAYTNISDQISKLPPP